LLLLLSQKAPDARTARRKRMRDHMFAADLTELARNDGGWAQLRQVRCNVFARYLSDFAAIRTRHQEARTLVVVIL